MPPVLDIAFHELSRGRAQDVVPCEIGRGVHEGHHVLQLVAEAVTAARLIKGRAAPHPAAESLVKQPARSEEHTSELQSHSDLVCRLLLEKKKQVNILWTAL